MSLVKQSAPTVMATPNERLLESTSKICVKTIIAAATKSDGIVSGDVSNASELNNTVALINNVVENEMIRRYGDVK